MLFLLVREISQIKQKPTILFQILFDGIDSFLIIVDILIEMLSSFTSIIREKQRIFKLNQTLRKNCLIFDILLEYGKKM